MNRAYALLLAFLPFMLICIADAQTVTAFSGSIPLSITSTVDSFHGTVDVNVTGPAGSPLMSYDVSDIDSEDKTATLSFSINGAKEILAQAGSWQITGARGSCDPSINGTELQTGLPVGFLFNPSGSPVVFQLDIAIICDPGLHFTLNNIGLTLTPSTSVSALNLRAPTTPVRGTLTNPQAVYAFVTDNQNQPVAGVPVQFAVTQDPSVNKSAALAPATATTDSTGAASTSLTPGDKPGIYIVTASCEGCNPSSVPIQVLVGCSAQTPLILQGVGTWATNDYDHETLNISHEGCALTALTMALNFAGATQDPGSLNTLLYQHGGYFPDGEVNWGPATRIGSPPTIPLHFDTLGPFIDSTNDLSGAEQAVEDELCAATPHPVIVAVRSPKSHKYQKHFVLVTGESFDPGGTRTFSINDPGGFSTILGTGSPYVTSAGDPEFATRGIVNDPEDLSSLTVAVDSSVNVIVTDPIGLKTGFDSNSDTVMQNIAHSAAFIDAIDDDVTGDIDESPERSVIISEPLDGTYNISLTGVSTSLYTLVLSSVAPDGTVRTAVQIPGVASPGSTSSVVVIASATAPPTAAVKTTFAGLLTDISNCLALKLITKQQVANALTAAVKAIQKLGRSLQRDALNGFIVFVKLLLKEKLITATGSQILIADATSLLAQIA